MKQLIPDNLVGNPKKLPSEMVKLVPLVGSSKSSSRRESKRTQKSVVKKHEDDALLETVNAE